MKLKEYPKEELPRERLIKYGASNLSNADLISIINNAILLIVDEGIFIYEVYK